MSPELITSITDRLASGRSRFEIMTELSAAGYSSEQAEDILAAASASTATEGPVAAALPPALIGVGALYRQALTVALREWSLLVKSFAILFFSLVVLVGVPLLGFYITDQWALAILILPISFVLSMLILLALGYSVIRAIYRRQDRAPFRVHLRWVQQHFWKIFLVTVMISIFTQIGYYLFVIPGLLAQLFFIFATQLVILERAKGTAAVRLSYRLVRDNFWAVMGRLLGAVVIVFILAVASALPVLWSLNLHGEVIEVLIAPALLVMVGAIVFNLWFVCVQILLLESLLTQPAKAQS